MNQTTRSIMERMLNIIEDYRSSQISFRKLVNDLEGSINAIEEKLTSEFYTDWYEHWGELEIILALGIEKNRQKRIFKELSYIKNIINHMLSH